MKAFSRSMIFAILLVIPFLMTAGASATIHGVVYEWNTFQPLENVIVNVNSTPVQSMVCKYGTYSFELPLGSYKIIAIFMRKHLILAEDFVNMTEEGSNVLDLLLFPIILKVHRLLTEPFFKSSISSPECYAVQSNLFSLILFL